MTGVGEDRGVSEVIGFILVFSFVIVAFTIYQGIVVPDQNRVVEFDHNQAVQGDMQDVRNAIMSAALGGAEQTVSIDLGATYPQRTIASNLGYSGGSVRTLSYPDTSRIAIANAEAVDRYGETGDYWNGSAVHRFDSKSIVYEPVYSRYSNAPNTAYENSMAYNRFGNGVNLSITGESLIDGKRITLVSLAGNLSESGSGSVSIDPEPISASTRRISIRNETHPVNITIPTRLNASWWNETLRDEIEGGHVTSVEDAGENQVLISLEEDTTYTLRMAKIGIGSSGSDEPVEYLTLSERPSGTVFNDTSHSITVEARDRFNNPVSGVQVNGTVASGNGSFANEQASAGITTSTDGEATFEYTAPSESGPVELEFNVTPESGGHTDYEVVTVNLSVKSSGAGGSGTDDINPGGEGSVILHDSTVQGGGNKVLDVTFDNRKNSSVNFTHFRVSFVYKGSNNAPENVDRVFEDGGLTYHDSSVRIGAPFTPLETEIELDPGQDTVSIEFDSGVSNSFLIVTFMDDGQPSTYFVST